MRVYFKPWSSLTALSMMLSAAACTGTDTTDPAAFASVSQAELELAVVVDGAPSAHEKLQAELDGKPVSLEELVRLLQGSTVESKEIVALLDGEQRPVEAYSALSEKELRFEGVRKLLDASSTEVDVCATFYPNGSSLRVCVVLPPTVSKPKQDPEMDRALAQVDEMHGLIRELAKRYPDPEKLDEGAFMQKEAPTLEKIAALYCEASGLGVPCDPTKTEGTPTGDKKQLGFDWFYWIRQFLSQVGVVPNSATCPQGVSRVELYHDDEDNRNANSRWGWLGGTVSNSNTLFRFCKVPGSGFYPLAQQGSQYNYALLQLGVFCPGGTSSYTVRHFDNEDSSNANWGSGSYFPNVNVLGRNWVMSFCTINGGSSSPVMSSFPNLGFSYGVFAPTNMPSPYNLQSGHLSKDDEDFLNINFWVNGPGNMMGDSRNTWFDLARVK